MPTERRRHIRKRVDLPVAIELGGERITAHLSDMSPGGAFIDTEVTPKFGTVVSLTVELDGKPLTLGATVRWAKPGGIGVQFGALGAKQTFALTEFLAGFDEMPDSRRF